MTIQNVHLRYRILYAPFIWGSYKNGKYRKLKFLKTNRRKEKDKKERKIPIEIENFPGNQ